MKIDIRSMLAQCGSSVRLVSSSTMAATVTSRLRPLRNMMVGIISKPSIGGGGIVDLFHQLKSPLTIGITAKKSNTSTSKPNSSSSAPDPIGQKSAGGGGTGGSGEEYKQYFLAAAFIDGKFCSSSSGRKFDVHNPSTGRVIGHAADCSVEDAKQAVAAAKKAFPGWRDTTAKERARLLTRLFELQCKHAEVLANLITVEMGKPVREARGEIAYGGTFLQWFAEEARRMNGAILQSPWSDKQLSYRKEPCGVVGIITPWNFPNAMITRKLGAALAAGCTVVVKPPNDTPYSALAIAKLSIEAGFPPGVINVVPCSPKNTPEVGDFLCDSPDISVISFTGSTAVGKYLLQRSAKTVKRLCLELGGDAPFIVFDSADVNAAAEGAIIAKFRNAGQTCVCANRIYAQEGVHDQFVAALTARMASELVMGDGMDERTTIGPLINEKAIHKVWSHVEDAVAKGAKVLSGGKKLTHNDKCFFFEPTLMVGITPEMLVMQEETFGPVAAVCKFRTEDEVLQLANASRHGLAGYFYSTNYQQIERVARKLEVGMIGINDGLLSCCEAPFGGVKESGLGREGSHFGLDEFVHIKYVCLGGLK